MERFNITSDRLRDMAEEYGSFYLYDGAIIEGQAKSLKEAFSGIDFLYSVKCNPYPKILQTLCDLGYGADAASAGEVLRAEEAGFLPEDIYYVAPGKTRSDIRRTWGKCTLIADSLDEVRWIDEEAERAAAPDDAPIHIGLRINPDFGFENGDPAPSKFGVDEDQAIAALSHWHGAAGMMSLRRVSVKGLQVHLRSQVLDTEALRIYYHKVLELADRFGEVCGGLDFVDMGSGIGVHYAPGDQPLDIRTLGKAVEEELCTFRKKWPGTRIMIETGRYLTCQAGLFVTTVVDRKVSCGRTYIILRDTMNQFLRPSLARLVVHYAREHAPEGREPLFTAADAFPFWVVKRVGGADKSSGSAGASDRMETVTLTGRLCTAADVIAEDVSLPKLSPGDAVIIGNAGSYAATLSPWAFSSMEKPTEFFI